MNCCDNSGAKNLYVRSLRYATRHACLTIAQIISVTRFGARLNRLPAAAAGDMVLATVKKGKPDLRKKVHQAIVVRQRKPWRRPDGVFLCVALADFDLFALVSDDQTAISRTTPASSATPRVK